MRRPNFFIVGAPRCGTSSLQTYLCEHPNVFMSQPKEPYFFADDFPNWAAIRPLNKYLALFEGASARHLAVGEASAGYLYSRVAISRIRDFDKNAKIIVMLRNPVDMIQSVHAKAVYGRTEDETSFEVAWRLQSDRQKGLHIPPGCRETAFLQYEELGKLGAQVERLVSVFPREQVHFALFDDFIQETRGVYEGVLAFLGFPSDGRKEFPRVNENRQARLAWMNALLRHPFAYRIHENVKRVLRVEQTGIGHALRTLNSRPVTREPLSPQFKRELVGVFRPDVVKLSRILNRNLSGWK